jgi:hypothetical protein
VFTALYALRPYIKQIRFVFNGLNIIHYIGNEVYNPIVIVHVRVSASSGTCGVGTPTIDPPISTFSNSRGLLITTVITQQDARHT